MSESINLLDMSVDYLRDLAGEWEWKRNTTQKNNREMAELDSLIEQLDEVIGKGCTEQQTGVRKIMKIVDRKTFMEIPENTLFAKWEPCWFGELMIKGETIGNDFIMQDIASAVKCNDSGEFAELCDHSAQYGVSLAMDFYCEERDGCFDEDQMFAVYERDDVLQLIERLKACVTDRRIK